MPTITINKTVFEKLVGKKLPLEELKDRISMLGTDLERIEGDEIEVEIFPDRPDLLSEQGLARALSSFIGVKPGLRKYDVKKSGNKVIVKDLPPEWPYVVACIVTNLKFDNEKIREVVQLQEKLGTTLTRNRKKGGLSLYPLDKIKFPVTFKGKKPEDIRFRPLGFPKIITAKQILSKHPKGRDYGSIMDGWKTYPVFEDAKGTIMSMPPIINSHDVGKIDEKTTDVFVEGTGPDLNTLIVSLAILTTSLADMGGTIKSIEMIYPTKKFNYPDLTPEKMGINLKNVNKLLGLELKETDLKKYLGRMGYGYEKGKALVPAYRADVLHEVDIIEDIAIAYGYENFKEQIPKIATVAEEDALEKYKNKVAQILIGLGLIETKTYHLTNKIKQCKNMNIDLELVELENALTTDYNALRTWLTPCLLEILQNNLHRDYPQNIFDMGVIFKRNPKTETGIQEDVRVSVLLCDTDANFTKIKQVADYLSKMLDKEFKIHDTEHTSFIPGRVGRITCGTKKIGYIGEIHPKVLESWQLENPVAALEINLSEIIK